METSAKEKKLEELKVKAEEVRKAWKESICIKAVDGDRKLMDQLHNTMADIEILEYELGIRTKKKGGRK